MKDLSGLDKYRIRDEMVLRLFGGEGDGTCGAFKVFVGGRSFFVVASAGGGWDHVSVSPASRSRKTCPTWEEMCRIKDMFFEPEEEAIQYHPRQSEYVDLHPYCLHLWRPNDGRELLRPPVRYV